MISFGRVGQVELSSSPLIIVLPKFPRFATWLRDFELSREILDEYHNLPMSATD